MIMKITTVTTIMTNSLSRSGARRAGARAGRRGREPSSVRGSHTPPGAENCLRNYLKNSLRNYLKNSLRNYLKNCLHPAECLISGRGLTSKGVVTAAAGSAAETCSSGARVGTVEGFVHEKRVRFVRGGEKMCVLLVRGEGEMCVLLVRGRGEMCVRFVPGAREGGGRPLPRNHRRS
jgi:hypothetical protein